MAATPAGMRDWRIGAGVAAGLGGIAVIASCVPATERPVARVAPHEKAVAEATPLLRKLQLDVAPADLPPVADPRPAVLAAPAFLAAARSTDDASHATDCLTAAVYYEARSEPIDGQRAVAQVVLNRVRDRAFPASVCGVVYQGSSRGTGCQFSFTCDGSLYRPREPDAWARAQAVATAALGGLVYAPVGAATHYHADSILPWWAGSLSRIGAIGHHIFYRWADSLERALGFRQRYAGVEPGAQDVNGAAPAMAAGVTIHRGEESARTQNGVAIHSNGQPAPTLAAVPADNPPQASPAVFRGVRIHRGDAIPDGDAAIEPAT